MRVSIRWCITESITKAHYYENDNGDEDDPPHVPVPENIWTEELEGYESGDVLCILSVTDDKALVTEPIRNNNILSIFKAMRRGLKKTLNNTDSGIIKNVYHYIGHFYHASLRLDKIHKFENGELICQDLVTDYVMFYGDLERSGGVWKMVIS